MKIEIKTGGAAMNLKDKPDAEMNEMVARILGAPTQPYCIIIEGHPDIDEIGVDCNCDQWRTGGEEACRTCQHRVDPTPDYCSSPEAQEGLKTHLRSKGYPYETGWDGDVGYASVAEMKKIIFAAVEGRALCEAFVMRFREGGGEK